MNIREDFHEDNFEDDEPVEHYQMLGMVIIRNLSYLYSFIIDSKFENRIIRTTFWVKTIWNKHYIFVTQIFNFSPTYSVSKMSNLSPTYFVSNICK